MIRRCKVVVLALLNVTFSAACGQSASAKIVAGAEHCREIHFLGGWKPTKGMKKAQQNHFAHFLFGSFYESRQTTAGPREYLVAAVDQIGSHIEYSLINSG
jgi:hypothetical protein